MTQQQLVAGQTGAAGDSGVVEERWQSRVSITEASRICEAVQPWLQALVEAEDVRNPGAVHGGTTLGQLVAIFADASWVEERTLRDGGGEGELAFSGTAHDIFKQVWQEERHGEPMPPKLMLQNFRPYLAPSVWEQVRSM